MAKRENHSLTEFFKTTKKANAINASSIETKSATDQFYTLCLNEQLGKCNNSICEKEKRELKAKCIEQEKKLREIQRAIDKCLEITQKKEKKIECLSSEIKVARVSDPIACDSNSDDVSKSNVTEKVNEPTTCTSKSINVNNIFSTFENVFTHDELARLRSIGPTKKDDSSFVLSSIRFLYKNDVEKISSLSLTGRSRGTESKQKMCPEKYDTIKDLFSERLTSMNLNSTEFSDRTKQMHKLMKNAFINIKRHGKPTDDDGMVRRINDKIKQTEAADIVVPMQ